MTALAAADVEEYFDEVRNYKSLLANAEADNQALFSVNQILKQKVEALQEQLQQANERLAALQPAAPKPLIKYEVHYGRSERTGQ